MDRIQVSTVIHAPPAEVYDFLVDFHRYGRYSEYLEEVLQHGDGDVGTEYEFDLRWWRLSYTVRSAVTGLEPPERIDWEILGAIDARGSLHVVPVDGSPEPHSHVTLDVHVDPGSLTDADLGLPRFLSPAALLDRVRPKAEAQAELIVERVVEDVEGQRRPVDLQIESGDEIDDDPEQDD